MNIEIALPERMSQSGYSLLKILQDNDTPILDLFVRESVQNSLDAAPNGTGFVEVALITGAFNPKLLNNNFEGIASKLNQRFSSPEAGFLAIRDFGTTGLTGPLSHTDVKNGEYGNLLKLVYEISKEQTGSGAGGSWGLGKTIYFRMGIGLVIYYSRIRTDRGYESRLAACMVENENTEDVILPSYRGFARRGIAWWGESVPGVENRTIPIRNEEEIQQILSVFGLTPYNGDQTGTTIIIPYVDEDKLLASNRIEEEGKYNPRWNYNLRDYLEIALKRWYTPRLFNQYYCKNGKRFLKASVNGKNIDQSEMEPVFLLIQALYNRSLGFEPEGDFISENKIEVNEKKLTTARVLQYALAGVAAGSVVTRSQLGMNIPINNPAPAYYLGKTVEDFTGNSTIVCYTRQPGMIVDYALNDLWTSGVPKTDPGNFQIVVFSLNSANTLKDVKGNLTLEEYIRRSEGANHKYWRDYSLENSNPRVVYRIQKNLSNWLVNITKKAEEHAEGNLNSVMAKKLAKLLMPESGFGKGPDHPNIKPPTGKTRLPKKGKPVSLSIYDKPEEIEFRNRTAIIRGILKANAPVSNAEIELFISTTSGNLSLGKWEDDLGTEMPFWLEQVQLNIQTGNPEVKDFSYTLSRTIPFVTCDDIKITLDFDHYGRGYALRIESKEKMKFTVKMVFYIHAETLDTRPVLRLVNGNE